MLFDTNPTTWDTMPTMQHSTDPTNYASFHSRINQQHQQPRTYQKSDIRSTRRYSSGTPTSLQNGYVVPPAQAINAPNSTRRVCNKGTYRSATFHQPNNTFNTYRQSQPITNQQPNGVGQLRTSSSFHGCIQQAQQQPQSQQMSYAGRNSYAAPQQSTTTQSKPSMYAISGNFHPGMKDVPIWLKSLRLHKYTRMFQEMSYDEMMALDEHKLEQRQVTKGARKKILQSLDKLRDRSQLIRQLEKCIDENGDVRCLIVELRAMMHTPIAPYKPNPNDDPKPSNYLIDGIGLPPSQVSDENLPGHIARLCIRLHELLFRNGIPKIQELGIEDEYLLSLLQVYDKILLNEAFTYRQRYCIYECKRVISRYMQEQKILNQSLALHTQQSQTQPTLVSSPSSGYYTMSPPSSSTRRNSDTKESVDDLTATTTATNSDDDFHVSNSAPSSPPAPFFNHYQSNQQFRRSPEQWSQQQVQKPAQCPPGFEWTHPSTNTTQQPRPIAQPTTNLAHFQPYVNDQIVPGVLPAASQIQRQLNGWFNQSDTSQYSNQNPLNLTSQRASLLNQWDQRAMNAEKANSLFDSDPNLCSYLVQQMQQQQRQQVATAVKPPKAPSPIGVRPSNFAQQKPDSEPGMPLTVAEKLKLIADDANGSEIIDLAVHFAMKFKSQKSRDNSLQTNQQQQQPVLWQNIKDQPKRQSNPQANWWTNQQPTAKPAVKPTNPMYLSNTSYVSDFNKKHDYNEPWLSQLSQQQDLSLSDQLTASTTSTTASEPNLYMPTNQNKSSQLDTTNLLNRMLNDTHICAGQSQQQQRIMRQYALPDDLTPTENRLFSSITRSDDLRSFLNEHPSESTLFSAFQPLPCTASGAVH